MESFEGRRVVVMGLGRFGGGVGVSRWLAERGADVLVTDTEEADRLDESIDQVRDLVDSGAIELRLGEHRVSDFTTTDLVVVNPAVAKPWDNRFIRSAQAAGVAVTTEIGLVCELIGRERVVGVTGSAGKSTVSSMIQSALNADGYECVLGGNIGGSLLQQAGKLAARCVVVMELSSAMLYWLNLDRWSPRVAVVTNLEPNHLDWHGSAEHYGASKQAILRHQQSGDSAIVGFGVSDWTTNPQVDKSVAGSGIRVAGCAIPGDHNAWNGAVALEAAERAGRLIGGRVPDVEKLTEGVRRFAGLPHRLRLVHSADGVLFYDDSKSTVPRATVLAVDAIEGSLGDAKRIRLICGGYDKEVDLIEVASLVDRVGGVYTIGQTGPAICEASRGQAQHCETLDVAVRTAVADSKAGDAVVLSPGCASWDQFEHFEARGRAFEAFARSMTRGTIQ
ncbi:MAG: Mur ligase family protein [Phycisphaerales bacterium]